MSSHCCFYWYVRSLPSLKECPKIGELMSFIVLHINIILPLIVWSKMWLQPTRKLWSIFLPFDLLIKQVRTHLFYIPNPNGNMVMMFGSWQLQLVTTSYDNHGQADYQLPWVEGEGAFEQNWDKNRHHLNGRGSCFGGNMGWRLLATRTQFQMASKYFFFILYIVVWFWILLLISIFKIFFFLFFQNYISFSISISMFTFYFILQV